MYPVSSCVCDGQGISVARQSPGKVGNVRGSGRAWLLLDSAKISVERFVIDLHFDLRRESNVEWIAGSVSGSVRNIGGTIKHDLMIGVFAHGVDTTLRNLKGHRGCIPLRAGN